MTKYVFLFVIVVLAFAAPAFAQNAFVDVPQDHWAYEYVDQLQQAGVLEGYPDGTFDGKRALTRYEFAAALSKIYARIPSVEGFASQEDLDALAEKVANLPGTSAPAGVTEAQLAEYAKIEALAKFASKSDLERLQRLVGEFQGELKNMGVDVSAMKRDVAALDARVAALEEAFKRVQWYGTFNTFAVANKNNSNYYSYNQNDQDSHDGTNLLNNVQSVVDFDLTVKGRVNETTSVTGVINYGNFLNYLASIDDDCIVPNMDPYAMQVTPYYMYAETKMNGADLTMGRFPLALTPYTLKKYDMDVYTTNVKTDDGCYPVDGVKANMGFFGADLTLFAVKTDGNDWTQFFNISNFTQMAGARGTIALPWGGNFGATYYRAWDANAWDDGDDYDKLEVYGGDYSALLFNKFHLVGSWTKSNWLITEDEAGVPGTNDDNEAWDVKVSTGMGKLGVGLGFKDIGGQFYTFGSWDKIGYEQNPTDVKGPYAEFSYPVSSNLKLAVCSEYLTVKDGSEDILWSTKAGVKYGLSKVTALTADWDYVKYSPDQLGAGEEDATRSYLTLGIHRSLGANAGLRVGYTFMEYNDGNGVGPDGGDSRSQLGVVQLGVSF